MTKKDLTASNAELVKHATNLENSLQTLTTEMETVRDDNARLHADNERMKKQMERVSAQLLDLHRKREDALTGLLNVLNRMQPVPQAATPGA